MPSRRSGSRPTPLSAVWSSPRSRWSWPSASNRAALTRNAPVARSTRWRAEMTATRSLGSGRARLRQTADRSRSALRVGALPEASAPRISTARFGDRRATDLLGKEHAILRGNAANAISSILETPPWRSHGRLRPRLRRRAVRHPVPDLPRPAGLPAARLPSRVGTGVPSGPARRQRPPTGHRAGPWRARGRGAPHPGRRGRAARPGIPRQAGDRAQLRDDQRLPLQRLRPGRRRAPCRGPRDRRLPAPLARRAAARRLAGRGGDRLRAPGRPGVPRLAGHAGRAGPAARLCAPDPPDPAGGVLAREPGPLRRGDAGDARQLEPWAGSAVPRGGRQRRAARPGALRRGAGARRPGRDPRGRPAGRAARLDGLAGGIRQPPGGHARDQARHHRGHRSALRLALDLSWLIVVVVVMASGSVRSSSSAGPPAASARSNASGNAAVLMTTSPWAP